MNSTRGTGCVQRVLLYVKYRVMAGSRFLLYIRVQSEEASSYWSGLTLMPYRTAEVTEINPVYYCGLSQTYTHTHTRLIA